MCLLPLRTCSAIFIDQRNRFKEYFVEILSGLAISQEPKLQNGAQLIAARKLINNPDFLRVSTTKCALTRRGIAFSSGSYRRQARRAECKTSLARPQFIATPHHCSRFVCSHSGHPVRGNELRTDYTKKRQEKNCRYHRLSCSVNLKSMQQEAYISTFLRAKCSYSVKRVLHEIFSSGKGP